jgi:hypothetical protein
MRGVVRAVSVGMAIVAGAGVAGATSYSGWGDTGWVYASKRECCDGAIAIARDYSARACLDTGGTPRFDFGAQRGTCRSEWIQTEDGSVLYRCYGEASVWCR